MRKRGPTWTGVLSKRRGQLGSPVSRVVVTPVLHPVPNVMIVKRTVLSVVLRVSTSVSSVSVIDTRVDLVMYFDSESLTNVLRPARFLTTSLVLVTISQS